MKKYFTIASILMVTICLIFYNFIYYPINLDINREDVAYANIIYYGDDVSQKVEDKENIELLVKTLNKLRFKEHKDESHLMPKSGVLLLELYNDKNQCIDTISFYSWAYRGGEYIGKTRKDGVYLKVKEDKNYNDLYDLCDKICGDPFDRLKFKQQYGR